MQHGTRIAVSNEFSVLHLQNVRLDQILQVALVDLMKERQLSVHDVFDLVSILTEDHPKITVIAQADQRKKELLLGELLGQLQQTRVNSALVVDLHYGLQILQIFFLL